MVGSKFPSDLVLTLNKQAERRAKQGYDVINATVGMFFKDDGSFPISRIFTSQDFSKKTKYTYSTTIGVPGYLENILPWFFQDKVSSLPADSFSIATPGGTGAVFLSFYELSERGYRIIYPEIGWPNYTNIAKATKADTQKYPNFHENRFNIEGISEHFKNDKIAVLINDPCQNPTGYSMTEEDWDKLITLLNKNAENAALILDLAYFDFANPQSKANIVRAIQKLDKRVQCFACFSFSKTFSIYGLRVGALTLFNGDKQMNIRLKNLARAAWSSGNVMGMNLIKHALDEEKNEKKLRKEIVDNRKMLQRRASLFLKEAQEVDLEYYPYCDGFFCSVKVKDALKTANNLKEKDIFLAPINENIIRVAFSCVPYSKISGLAGLIKDADQ